MKRSPDLQHFLDCLDDAILARATPDSAALRLQQTIAAGLQVPQAAGGDTPVRLPVCVHFDSTVADIQTAPHQRPEVKALANALRAIEPHLVWERRWTAKPGDGGFYDGHANANIVGPEGLEIREDIWIGVSLVAPQIDYPEHHHPPEEVYVALSPGEWRNEEQNWFTPGAGGLVYNRHDTRHAMRAGAAPLLAVWSLWVGA